MKATLFVAVGLGLMLPRLLLAQDTTLTVTVTQIAGQNVYLNAGANDGITTNDTLRVESNGQMVGRFRVVSAASKQSVVAFADAPFPVTRGSILTVYFVKRDTDTPQIADAPPPEPEAAAPPPERTSRPITPRRRPANRVKVLGRLLLNFSLLDSETIPQAAGVDPIQRTFITPSLNINTTVSNLPSGVRLHLHMRSEYRHSSQTTLLQTNSFRTYQLNVEKRFSFGEMQFGRFYDRSTPFGGYWDGGTFMIGSRKMGFGGAVGFMPDRANEGFSMQFPRFAGFAHYQTPSGNDIRYRAGISYQEVHPTADYLNHRYAGIMQEIGLGPISLDQDLQFDQDPTSQNWVVSQFQANTRFKVNQHITLRGRYTIRQPYRLYSLGNPISIRRDQVGGGVNFRMLGYSVGADYRARYTRGDYESRTYTVYFSSPELQPLGMSFSASGNHWESDFGTALFVNGGVSKSFNASMLRFDYGFYRSTNANQINPIDLHRFSLSTTIPFTKKLYWNARGSLQPSPYLRSISLNTSLQIRF